MLKWFDSTTLDRPEDDSPWYLVVHLVALKRSVADYYAVWPGYLPDMEKGIVSCYELPDGILSSEVQTTMIQVSFRREKLLCGFIEKPMHQGFEAQWDTRVPGCRAAQNFWANSLPAILKARKLL